MQQASNCRADAVKLNMFIVSFKIVTFLNLTGAWRFGRIPIATKTGRFCEVSEPPRGTRVTPTSFAMILGEKAPEHWRRWQEDKQPERANVCSKRTYLPSSLG